MHFTYSFVRLIDDREDCCYSEDGGEQNLQDFIGVTHWLYERALKLDVGEHFSHVDDEANGYSVLTIERIA